MTQWLLCYFTTIAGLRLSTIERDRVVRRIWGIFEPPHRETTSIEEQAAKMDPLLLPEGVSRWQCPHQVSNKVNSITVASPSHVGVCQHALIRYTHLADVHIFLSSEFPTAPGAGGECGRDVEAEPATTRHLATSPLKGFAYIGNSSATARLYTFPSDWYLTLTYGLHCDFMQTVEFAKKHWAKSLRKTAAFAVSSLGVYSCERPSVIE